MRVRFWGTRGSIPSPGPETVHYGGNTSCVEVRADDGTLLVLDGGTGARKLAATLAQARPAHVHLFITHTHSDHVHGLPFFIPVLPAGTRLTVYGPAGIDRSLPTAVGGLMEYSYFPVPLKEFPARVEFEELAEGEFSIGNVCVRAQYLNHTAPCLGYRFEIGGASVVYATDHEPHAAHRWRSDRPAGRFESEWLLHAGDARHAEFLRDADLVIHDAQYTEAEYPTKIGWGHSPVEYVVDLARAAGVKRLALFHHDPSRTDEALEAVLTAAREPVANLGADLDVIGAAEGAEFFLEERAAKPAVERALAKPAILARATVLVADDDDDVAAMLEMALQDDGYEVMRAADGDSALRLAREHRPDLILLDVLMPGLDGFSVCRNLRADEQCKDLPIVMLTARADASDIQAGFCDGVTDYITKPLVVSQLRARIRSWLARSAERDAIAAGRGGNT